MACPVKSVSIEGLRLAHFKQLLQYVVESGREGWYYGSRKYFRKRHEEIYNFVAGIVDALSPED